MGAKKSKREIAVIDMETDPFKYGRIPEPFIFGYYNGSEYHQFYDIEKFVEFIKSRDEIIYAHNGGKFDFHFLTEFFENDSKLTIINGRLTKFEFGLAELRDSFNILPFALSVYQKEEFDYKLLEKENRNKHGNKKLIETYLKSDCVNLYNLVSDFIHRFGNHLTIAGTAFAQWKKISKHELPRSKFYYYDRFYPYYYGGRVECFQTGLINKDFSVIDINSAYPRAMLESHPYGLGFEMIEVLPSFEHPKFNTGFYTVEGESDGGLPFRAEDGKLEFPNDKIKRIYHMTGWELRAAIETKTFHKWKFHYGYLHYEMVNFSDYINYFYDERLKAKAVNDKAGDIFAKLLMNSLYGKFASDPREYNNYHITDDEKIKEAAIISAHEGINFAGNLGKWFVIETALEDREMVFYNVATAASITGYVRAFLWRSICKVGIKNVLYCDTDSLAASNTDVLTMGEALGEWKHEGDFIHAGIAGKKLYAFRNQDDSYKFASKGARLTPEEILEVASGGSAYYQFEAPSFSFNRGANFIERNILMTAGKLLENKNEYSE